MDLKYFAWQHEVFACEVEHHLLRDDFTPPRWYAVVRPAPGQKAWVTGSDMGPNGSIAIPANVVRDTREEALADISIGALRNLNREN